MNMEISRVRRAWIFALALCLTPRLALAGDEVKSDAQQDRKERIAQLTDKPEILFSDEFDIRALSVAERNALVLFRYEREARQLHQMMLSRLELTDLQKAAIGRIVEDQIDNVRRTFGAPRSVAGRQREPKAEVTNPKALVDPSKTKMDRTPPANAREVDSARDPRRGFTSTFDDPTPFLKQLATELSGEQYEQFRKFAHRWEMVRPYGAADDPLRQLIRAVRDPALIIEAEQRKSAEKCVQQTAVRLGRDRRYRDKRIEAFEKAKAEVMSELNPAQREHLESTLKELRTKLAEEVLMVMDMRAKEKAEKEAESQARNEAKSDKSEKSDKEVEKPTD